MQYRFFTGASLYPLIGLALLAGCSSGTDTIEVSGKVTYNGTPIDDGDITFVPDQGTTAPQTSGPIKNGEFRLSGEAGLLAGTYEVRVNAYRESTNKSNLLGSGPGALDKPPETGGIPAREQFLPAKFNTGSTIEKFVVAPGQAKQEKNFELKN